MGEWRRWGHQFTRAATSASDKRPGELLDLTTQAAVLLCSKQSGVADGILEMLALWRPAVR